MRGRVTNLLPWALHKTIDKFILEETGQNGRILTKVHLVFKEFQENILEPDSC